MRAALTSSSIARHRLATRASAASSSCSSASRAVRLVYLLLATNLGARLGLLVASAALFGWLDHDLVDRCWWVYGIDA